MRVVFAGTPEFSLSSLQSLIDHPECEVVGVYTQPDRPSGRGKSITMSPVKKLAQHHELAVFQPHSFKDQGALNQLVDLQPALMVVTAYGLILPEAVLSVPIRGCVNVHASLLPRWRGAAPIQRAIQFGDQNTGVTLMQMERGLDTGPILASTEVKISAQDTGGTLHDKLSVAGGDLLAQKLEAIMRGELAAMPQDDSSAIYAEKLKKSEGVIDWSRSAAEITRMIMAFNPWPGTSSKYQNVELKFLLATAVESETSAVPGQVISADRDGLLIGTGSGAVLVSRLQKQGSKALDADVFLNGFRMQPGECFE